VVKISADHGQQHARKAENDVEPVVDVAQAGDAQVEQAAFLGRHDIAQSVDEHGRVGAEIAAGIVEHGPALALRSALRAASVSMTMRLLPGIVAREVGQAPVAAAEARLDRRSREKGGRPLPAMRFPAHRHQSRDGKADIGDFALHLIAVADQLDLSLVHRHEYAARGDNADQCDQTDRQKSGDRAAKRRSLGDLFGLSHGHRATSRQSAMMPPDISWAAARSRQPELGGALVM
jgi:hypothetical protein